MRHKFFFAVAVLFTLANAILPLQAADLNPEMRSKIEAVIKSYLLNNPEIIRDATAALVAREKEAEAAALEKALSDNRNALERDPGSPVSGNLGGDVTVVQFFDYNCGYCKRVAPVVSALVKADKKVRLVYKEFAILGPTSVLGAKAALAAQRQNKYLAFHDALYGLPKISEATIRELSGRLALDYQRLVKDMNDPAIAAQIESNYRLASSLGINGTPTFVIGNRLIPGAIDTASIQRIVDEQRALIKNTKNQ